MVALARWSGLGAGDAVMGYKDALAIIPIIFCLVMAGSLSRALL